VQDDDGVFDDPRRTVPEASRLLRPGGLFAFSTGSPLLFICWPAGAAEVSDRLQLDYFDQQRSAEESIHFSLTYGDWIRLFRRNGLLVEDLIEPRPPAGARSSYRTEENHAWSRRWPAELIWKLRKEE
jgi:SAM-dependent methyltransferase